MWGHVSNVPVFPAKRTSHTVTLETAIARHAAAEPFPHGKSLLSGNVLKDFPESAVHFFVRYDRNRICPDRQARDNERMIEDIAQMAADEAAQGVARQPRQPVATVA